MPNWSFVFLAARRVPYEFIRHEIFGPFICSGIRDEPVLGTKIFTAPAQAQVSEQIAATIRLDTVMKRPSPEFRARSSPRECDEVAEMPPAAPIHRLSRARRRVKVTQAEARDEEPGPIPLD